MEREEYKSVRDRALEEQKQYFLENAEPRRFAMIKKIFLWFLLIYLLVHFVLSVWIMILQGSVTAFAVGVDIVKMLFQMFLLGLVLNHMGIWRQNFLLYVMAAYDFAALLRNSKAMEELAEYLSCLSVASGMAYRALMWMEVIYPLILLVMALWLTVPRRNRELSEEISAMFQESVKDLTR